MERAFRPETPYAPSMNEPDTCYVVSHDYRGSLYIACNPDSPLASDTSNWFITRDPSQAENIGAHHEAREIADELNGKAIEPVYNLTDPEKRRWVVVNRFA
jgi:hypothetical protein